MGRTRFRMVVGETNGSGFNFLNASEINYLDGMKNGAIVNLDSVTEALIKLVEDISQKTNKKINSTFVNISGLNLEQKSVSSVITLPQRSCEISKKNIDDLIESCKIVSVPLDRHLLYLLPLEYIIDGQDGIKEPIGLYGNRLEAKILIITAPFNQVQNVVKAVNSAGIEVEEIVLTSLANANSLLTLEEKREGILLIDFKTDLTELAIFKNGSIVFFETISRGQGAVTDEIAIKFKIPFEVAEELKIRYAFLDNNQQDVRNQETVPLEWMGLKQQILRGELNKIVNEQTEILFDLISDKLKGLSNFNNIIKRGAMVNGGCISMEGFLEKSFQKLGFMIRAGVLKQDIAPLGNVYITSSGLLKMTYEKKAEKRLKVNTGFLKKVYQKADELLTDYF